MKRIAWVLFFCCLYVSLLGQRKADYGIFGGVSTYTGDINPGTFLNSPRPAGGLFYRFNLNPRQALRASLFYGGLAAADSNSSNDFQQSRGASFSGTIGEFILQFEFNFFPYSAQGKTWDYTPYIAAGLGGAYVNTVSSKITPVIPFSLGFKINIYKNMGLEAEYGFRKTFYDNFDGLKNKDFSASSVLHNNDWYSFAGLSLTWKFYSKLAGCPAYIDADSKRKR
jgi:hypothetical protein